MMMRSYVGRFPMHPLPPPEKLRFTYLLRTSNPTRYWASVPFPFQERPQSPPINLFLLAASPSITGNGLFFNPVPWLLLAGIVLAASILLWIPLVKSITWPIARITQVAEEIARGNFNIHVEEQRGDEIGRLGVAINHMSGQLETHITAQRESDKVVIAITDHGPGVPEGAISHLFEPFYRPEAVRNRKSGGVGLGLAIVKTYVQACGGTVHAKNLSPRGFAITMRLLASKP